MLLKSDIETVYRDQQAFLKQPEQALVSRAYLETFVQQKTHIEVLAGIRRCGKSTVMKQLARRLYKHPAYFHLEDSRLSGFELADFQKLYEIAGEQADAWFFDEIQNVEAWEIFVRQLHDRGKKVYVTGSNASLLSRELGTRLTGRYVRHELFPFSYKELLVSRQQKPSAASFNEYVDKGGFPEFRSSGDAEMLRQLFRDIVFRDIAVRYGVRNSRLLMELALYLASNTGKETSYNRLKNTFGIGSASSVSDYLSWFEDAYLFFLVPRFSYSAQRTSKNPKKVYSIDTGLVQANTLSFSKDKGRLLENAVFLFLRQSGYTVSYFKEKRECDFVVFDHKKCKYVIQVCETVDRDNLQRETEGLYEAMAFFKLKEGLIITRDQEDELKSDQGLIRLVPAFKFTSSGQ